MKKSRAVSTRINKRVIRDNLKLLTMVLPTIVLLGVFSYWPMFGIVLAFKNSILDNIFVKHLANLSST